ncbi:lamin tail domain-containing protein [Kitasatospora cheerisanensis]|uniref:ComA n=1 Tax=Kitasatospora cheerisanensis KCTC 2395 TaxID=1348663 RepID=A0A066Z2S5_9ACTN|nr:lamin tail domain-containing protein [Kitasatospora cheerisanensis]KDN84631.1 ComA [Kitasatospora cheerisanensis KCTC 2395]
MSKVTTSGTWTAVSPTPPEVTGLNTGQITWGTPADGSGGKSGYAFSGGTIDLKADGSEAVLGTFTHQNFPVFGGGVDQFDVDLVVRVRFEEDREDRRFTYRFHHFETPNDGPVPDDEVDLPTRVSPESVTVDGEEYAAVITGFKRNGEIVNKFLSPENDSNSADIVAVLSRVGAPDVTITEVCHKGEVKYTQADEYVEIVNRGTAHADISGWILYADDPGQHFTFPPGTTLKAGRRIRVYTDEVHPEWGGYSFGSGRAIWHDKGDTAHLLDTDETVVSTYSYGTDVS